MDIAIGGPGLDVRFDLQPASHRLVVLLGLMATIRVASLDTSLDISLYLHAASQLLVVLQLHPTHFHMGFDFHGPLSLSFENLMLIAARTAAYLYRRKRKAKLLVWRNIFGRELCEILCLLAVARRDRSESNPIL